MRLRKRITSEMVGERLLACGVKRECAELERAFGGGFEDVEPPVLVSEMRSEARHDVADTALVAITSLRVTIVEVRVTVGSERTSRLKGRNFCRLLSVSPLLLISFLEEYKWSSTLHEKVALHYQPFSLCILLCNVLSQQCGENSPNRRQRHVTSHVFWFSCAKDSSAIKPAGITGRDECVITGIPPPHFQHTR